MKTAACSPALFLSRSRLADFVELTKPRIAVLVLFTVAVGALLAPATPDVTQLAHTLLGTALVAAGASALNQLFEGNTDALMRRTENRPVPAGRLGRGETLVFGTALALGGLAYLALVGKHPLAAGVAAFTLLSYVLVYTPLKRVTTLNTLVGAVPGALPPVIGWTSATGQLEGPALVLFVIVFLWQVPHFLAIAWIYREDYARAGLKMLPVEDVGRAVTARHMVAYCLALIPGSLSAVWLGQAGLVFAAGAVVLGLGFTKAALGFARDQSPQQARRVLHASLVYLPLILGLWLADSWLGTAWNAWAR